MSLKPIGNQLRINIDACQAWNAKRPPCRSACPVDIDVPGYVTLISKGKYSEALDVIMEKMPFPSICGRVCHHPCESACIRNKIDQPIAIRDLKRFVGDRLIGERPNQEIKQTKKQSVAIIGSGPAGLTAAHDLALMGYKVTVFEELEKPGGMVTSCIPDYRIPIDIAEKEINLLLETGIKLRTGERITGYSKLFENGFQAVLLAMGAKKPKSINISGMHAKGVISGLSFLRDIKNGKRPELGERVIVMGGGNVAIDCAQSTVRLGAKKVHIICLEKREEMPAHEWQVQEALEEGVMLHTSLGPFRIITSNNRVTGLETIKCTNVFDKDGKFSPTFEEDSLSIIKADTIIIAIGQEIDIKGFEDIEITPSGTFKVDPLTLETSVPGVFAAGDCVSGPASFVEAVQSGHMVSEAIDSFLGGRDLKTLQTRRNNSPSLAEEWPIPRGIIRRKRQDIAQLDPASRKGTFKEISTGYREKEAVREASRCLNCGICGYCIENFGCIAMVWTTNPDLPYRVPEIDLALCVGCGVCGQICPHKAIEEIRDGG